MWVCPIITMHFWQLARALAQLDKSVVRQEDPGMILFKQPIIAKMTFRHQKAHSILAANKS